MICHSVHSKEVPENPPFVRAGIIIVLFGTFSVNHDHLCVCECVCACVCVCESVNV